MSNPADDSFELWDQVRCLKCGGGDDDEMPTHLSPFPSCLEAGVRSCPNAPTLFSLASGLDTRALRTLPAGEVLVKQR